MKKTYCKDTGFVQQIGVNELHKERIKTNICKMMQFFRSFLLILINFYRVDCVRVARELL